MKNRGATSCILLLFSLVMSCMPAAGQVDRKKAKFVPPDGKVLVFVGAGWGDWGESYTRATGHVPAGVHIFWLFTEKTTFFRECDKNAPAGAAVAITLKFVQPSGRDGGNPRDPSVIPEILGGKRDKALAAMAEEFKRTRRPIFVNLGSESNNSFFITPEESIAAFRYIHDRWQRLGVRNVAYVWKPGPGIWRPGVGLVNGNYRDFYPGDNYVDWIASGYYGGDPETAKHTGGLKTFYSLSQMARSRGKPFMIAESGPFSGTVGTGGRQTWDSWFRPFFEDIRRFGVGAVVYNNFGVLPDAPKWGEQRIARMERPIQEAWGREMKDPMYLGASPGLFAGLGFDAGRTVNVIPAVENRGPDPARMPAGEPFQIRSVRFKIDEEGDCRLTVDAKGDGEPPAEIEGKDATLLSVADASVRRTDVGTHRMVYSFDGVRSTSDFSRSALGAWLPLAGISIDHASRTLLLSPIKTKDVESSELPFPRSLRLPISLAIDFVDLTKYSVFVNLKTEKGWMHLGVSPGHPGWHEGGKVFAHWLHADKKNFGQRRTVLVEKKLEPGTVVDYGFRTPVRIDPFDDRFMLNVVRHGRDPVGIRRLEVEGKVVPSFGLGWESDKTALKLKTIIKDSPSERAGLLAGDVVVSLNGERFSDVAKLVDRLGKFPAGQEVKLVVKRAGQEKTVIVKGE